MKILIILLFMLFMLPTQVYSGQQQASKQAQSVLIEDATFVEKIIEYITSVTFITLLGTGFVGLLVWYGKSWITFQFDKRKAIWLARRKSKLDKADNKQDETT